MMGYLFAQADAARIPLPDRSVDLVIGSPPYTDARLYLDNGNDLGISRDCRRWVDWMLSVTAESLRVARNCVIWIAAGVTRDRNYQPACEGLMWEWWQRSVGSRDWLDGIEMPGEAGSMYRPCYWHRVGIPGSGHNDWFRADVETCMCFKRPGELPCADNTACGHPPKWAPGGEMSNRVKDGHRRNQWGRHENCKASGRKADGTLQGPERPSHVVGGVAHTKRMKGKNHETGSDMEAQYYVPPDLANPGNLIVTEEEPEESPDDLGSSLIHTTTGGGQLGWAGAHANEAPYPEAIPEFFVKSLTGPGDLVLDPFSGSGTTTRVANRLGRRSIGFDIRKDQCSLGIRGLERPHQPVVRQSRKKETHPLLDQLND